MKEFLGADFLLKSELAKKLFEEVKSLPIIDYHCHLDPKEIADDKRFKNITEVWLGGDHYKWRLLRANGVSEEFITGNADDYEKFIKWAETVEDLIGSPIYHWTHLELQRYFNYNGLLSKNTAKEVWEHCNKIINTPDFCVWNILKKFNVESICTTDDPADDLFSHQKIKASELSTTVCPTLRPSKAFAISDKSFAAYIKQLSKAADIEITDYNSLVDALYKRIEFFHENGCRLSDNSYEPPVYEEFTADEVNEAVIKALNGEKITLSEENKYKTALFQALGKKFTELDWAMQMHMNVVRNNNSRMYNLIGADRGFDSISDVPTAYSISRLLDSLDMQNLLPKTVLYNLNPSADDMTATMAGNFQGGTKGKIQYGAAWWFNDTRDGMEKQMKTLANHGMLARFVGMLTDSRSFLSYTRHEYFRRILCNLIAEWVENGEFPNEFNKLKQIVSDISYYNARDYFKL